MLRKKRRLKKRRKRNKKKVQKKLKKCSRKMRRITLQLMPQGKTMLIKRNEKYSLLSCLKK